MKIRLEDLKNIAGYQLKSEFEYWIIKEVLGMK